MNEPAAALDNTIESDCTGTRLHIHPDLNVNVDTISAKVDEEFVIKHVRIC